MKNGVPIHYAWSQILAFVFLLLTSTVSAQTQTIKGTIVDASSEPIIGASVLVEGTTNGGITDLDGNFTLMNVPSTGKLVVSFVGYQTQTVDIKGQTVFKLGLLKEELRRLDSLILRCADATAVPAGGALAVYWRKYKTTCHT